MHKIISESSVSFENSAFDKLAKVGQELGQILGLISFHFQCTFYSIIILNFPADGALSLLSQVLKKGSCMTCPTVHWHI